MSEGNETAKIGDGHASAMFRQGLRELRGSMYPESNVAQQPEYGLYGTRTPGEVAEARRADSKELDEEQRAPSVLDERLKEAEQRHEVRSEDRDRDLER